MGLSVEQIMTEEVATASEETTLASALELMQDNNIRHLPVVRGGRLVGMLTDRDLRGLGLGLVVDMESLDKLEARLGAPVGTVMSTNLLTVSRITDVVEVVDLLLGERVGAVPVTDGEDLVGIVSYVDVLRAWREQME